MSRIDNPFLVYGYEGPEYFCDRKEETKKITSALKQMEKKIYLSPDIKVHQVKATAILAESGAQTQDANQKYEDGSTDGWY